MPRFIYTAKSQPDKIIQGDIEAESQQEAINKLTKIGYFPVSIKVEDLCLNREGIFCFRKISNQDIVLFTSQLSSLINSGINILDSLNIISHQTRNKYLKEVNYATKKRVQAGEIVDFEIICLKK